jgi:TonB family protein
MAVRKREIPAGLRRIGESLTEAVEAVLSRWERSGPLLAYTRLRRRFSGSRLPGIPETADLDPYLVLSLGLHLLAALLVYLLAARVVPLAERPPISVRILETKAQAPAAAPEQQPSRQEETRQAETPPQKPKPKTGPSAPQAAPPPVEKPTLTPKVIPQVATAAPQAPSAIPKAIPKETAPKVADPDLVIADKGLLPRPVTPFQAEAPPAGAPREAPRSFAAPPAPPQPQAAPTEISPVPAHSAPAPRTAESAIPSERTETALEGFQQPTGPVVVPERFLKGGRPQTAPGAGVELIDTSDPDFTEYFELIKRRVYAAWRYPEGVRGVHKVSVRFTLDRAGAGHGVQVVRSTNSALNASAVDAMHRASPFPPIPEKFRTLVGQPLTLIFTVTIQ